MFVLHLLLKGVTRCPLLPREMGHSGGIQDNANSVVLDPDQEGGKKSMRDDLPKTITANQA